MHLNPAPPSPSTGSSRCDAAVNSQGGGWPPISSSAPCSVLESVDMAAESWGPAAPPEAPTAKSSPLQPQAAARRPLASHHFLPSQLHLSSLQERNCEAGLPLVATPSPAPVPGKSFQNPKNCTSRPVSTVSPSLPHVRCLPFSSHTHGHRCCIVTNLPAHQEHRACSGVKFRSDVISYSNPSEFYFQSF